MYVQFKDGVQEKYPVWENVFLLNASSSEEAAQKAERIGKYRESNSDSFFTWEGRTAEWRYAGMRKLITVSNSNSVDNLPDDEAEITYSEFEVADYESLKKLADGQDVTIQYIAQ